jgi:hypothetical protein
MSVNLTPHKSAIPEAFVRKTDTFGNKKLAEQEKTEMTEDLSVGQVQWHCSEEDGGPDVGILLRLSESEHLWVGELLDAEGGGVGFVVYGPDAARRVFRPEEYDDLRQLFEEHIAPAIRSAPSTGKGL